MKIEVNKMLLKCPYCGSKNCSEPVLRTIRGGFIRVSQCHDCSRLFKETGGGMALSEEEIRRMNEDDRLLS